MTSVLTESACLDDIREQEANMTDHGLCERNAHFQH